MRNEIECLELAHGGMRAKILNLGAALFELEVCGSTGPRPVILRNRQPRDYWDNPHYLGAVAGRCANRIRGGRCDIEGRPYQLDRNERGITHLHGGSKGFSRRLWSVKWRSEAAVELELHSLDGDQGYPGNLVASCRYDLLPDFRVRLSLTAVTDRTTLVNLAGHAYFNLEQGRSILDHTAADRSRALHPGGRRSIAGWSHPGCCRHLLRLPQARDDRRAASPVADWL